MKKGYLLALVLFLSLNHAWSQKASLPINISGIYPHLAFYNNEGECGTGAVVPWAGSLWVITYGPHLPLGSSDKLYQISPSLDMTIRPESVGGTPANRMIHKESNQLFIGPYAISAKGEVRTIPVKIMPGRLTGNARHLTQPTEKIYFATMEEGFYEVDTKTLDVNTLYKDKNINPKVNTLPGDHGKGLYSGQGVMVFSNNGELSRAAMTDFDATSGVLAEWDGIEWKVIRRNQFVEVTGPGGIEGNPNPNSDPIWVTGWDHRSAIVGVRSGSGWSFYRIPKASHTYDGAHGWNTEWPRIRNMGTPSEPDYLMTMHGLFWRFPSTFTAHSSAGIRPRSAYLKVVGDFARWNDRLVFGCDDAAQKEFLNKRNTKGAIEGPGQSNSNLWFTSTTRPDELGVATANGAVWINEQATANTPSEPFLFAGWENRTAWLKNHSDQTIIYTFQQDKTGDNQWSDIASYTLLPGQSVNIVFDPRTDKGEWIRAMSDKNAVTTLSFNYSNVDRRSTKVDKMFAGMCSISEHNRIGGLLYGLGNNRRKMAVLSDEGAYYELNEKMELTPSNDSKTVAIMNEKFSIPHNVVTLDKGSVLVIDDKGRRWRLPLGDSKFDAFTTDGRMRICREVSTERDLFNCHGTFYELPAENADGYAKIRPIASHNLMIHDYAAYRGMLIMTGISPRRSKNNSHIFTSADGKAAVWAGAIDDLWQLGLPTGKGGPWIATKTETGVPSDPYLIGFYNSRSMTLSHNSLTDVTFTVEVDPTGNGQWLEMKKYTVSPAKKLSVTLPKSFSARWIRFTTDTPTVATTWLEYK